MNVIEAMEQEYRKKAADHGAYARLLLAGIVVVTGAGFILFLWVDLPAGTTELRSKLFKQEEIVGTKENEVKAARPAQPRPRRVELSTSGSLRSQCF